MPLKAYHKIIAIVVATLLVFRLAITLRTGAIVGDDIDLLFKCFNWWRGGDALSFILIPGSAGFLYVDFHSFAWAVLVELCNFRLGPLFLVHAVLMLVPALLLAWQFRGRSEMPWAVLLSVSSPLMAYFSQSLFPLWWVLPLAGNIVLEVAVREDRGKPYGSVGLLFVGLVSGYVCSVYPSAAPLTLGLFFWLLLKRRLWRAHAAYLIGCVVGYMPGLVIIISHWNQLTPQLVVGQGHIAWAALFGGIFRYFGDPPVVWMNEPAPWRALKQGWSTATVVIWLLLLVGWGLAMIQAKRKRRAVPGEILLAACSLAAFLIFTAVTRTESWYHQSGNLCWISALVIPWLVQRLVPRHARIILATLVGFNVVGLLLIFGPRLIAGSSAEGRYEPASGPGPSWWMQQQIADELACRAREELAAGDRSLLAVRCAPINALPHSFPLLFRIQNPDLDRKVAWVPQGDQTCSVLVAQDPQQPYRLRLFDMAKRWHLPEQPYRRVVRVLITGGAGTSGQIAIDLGPADPPPNAILDADGKQLPYWVEDRPTPTTLQRIWIKIPPVPAGCARFFLYYGGPVNTRPLQAEEVFEVFEDFDHGLSGWRESGPAVWRTEKGRAIVQSPPNLQGEIFSSLMKSGRFEGPITIEARVRFRAFPTRDDLGLVFAAGEDGCGFTAYAHGQGAVYIGEVNRPNFVETLDGNNSLWKFPKAELWMVFQVEWHAPLFCFLINEREVLRGALVDARESGGVGLGILRGTGQPNIEIDWFRVRRAYPNQVRIILGAPEARAGSVP